MSLLDELRDAIVKLANPRRILLFSQKNRPDGTPSSVKLVRRRARRRSARR